MILQFQPDCGTRMSIKNQHGIALMTVIVFLFILSLTWLSFSFISSYEREAVQNQVASERASYVAEAGIQQALYFLSQDWNWQNWTDNKWGNGGTRVIDGTVTYYQWSGNLGDTAQAYTVQIRNDGKIQSKIRVGSPDLDSPKRTIEVELGSAFDFGLYSHDQMKFNSGFTVSGTNSTGYAYAKNGITNPTFLTADKKVGNYSTAPWFLPKEIPLPELWKTKTIDQTGNTTWVGFEAKINGTPTSTTVRYNNDNGETNLEAGALLHNKTRGNFRRIIGFDTGANTFTTLVLVSPDNWTAGDTIVVERIEVYENYWDNTLSPLLDNLNSYAGYGNPVEGQISAYSQTDILYTRQFSSVKFESIPTVQFYGNMEFSGKIKINGNAIFGRRHATFGSGATTISGDMVVNGNAYFFNKVTITGRLCVNGSLYIFDANGYRNNVLLTWDPDHEDWQEYLAVDSDQDNRIDFDDNANQTIDPAEIDTYIDTADSGTHGIDITSSGGIFAKGTIALYSSVNSTVPLKISGYCYTNGYRYVPRRLNYTNNYYWKDGHYLNQAIIYHGDISGSWIGLTRIENGNNPETAFYVRNGRLEVGNVVTSPPSSYVRTLYTDLQARGGILVAQDIILHRDLFRPAGDTNPLFLACNGKFTLSRYVKTNAGSPFYGLIYVGEEAKFGLSSTSGVTIGGGQIIANSFNSDTQTNPLYGTSITYLDYKTQLYNFGFTNNEDYSRPLFWRETE